MYHHDSRNYDVALDETAKAFKEKLDAMVHRGRASAVAVLEKIEREVPVDRVVRADALTFAVDERGRITAGANGAFAAPVHRHALGQLAQRAGMPDAYLTRLLERAYGPELLVENLRTIYSKEEPQKFLIRAVNGEVRGVLSDSYRRMDSRPILEAFAKSCEVVGAVPVEGVGGDLRWAMRAVLPHVFQPSHKRGSEEFVAFGAQLSSSDFGAGALSLKILMIRVWCSNLATAEEALRQVHLGRRLDENIEFSERTYRLDTRTQVSAVKDMVGGLLSPSRINEMVGRIGHALEERIDPKAAWASLPKLGLLKSEVESVRQVFLDGGVEMLPPGTTVGRLSNAISWFAKSAAPERRLELENVAGKMLLGAQVRRERIAA